MEKLNILADEKETSSEGLFLYKKKQISIVEDETEDITTNFVETDPRCCILNRDEFKAYAKKVSRVKFDFFLMFPDPYKYILSEIYDLKKLHTELEYRTILLYDMIKSQNSKSIIVSSGIKNVDPILRKYFLSYINSNEKNFDMYGFHLLQYKKNELAQSLSLLHQIISSKYKHTLISEWKTTQINVMDILTAYKNIEIITHGKSNWFCTDDYIDDQTVDLFKFIENAK